MGRQVEARSFHDMKSGKLDEARRRLELIVVGQESCTPIMVPSIAEFYPLSFFCSKNSTCSECSTPFRATGPIFCSLHPRRRKVRGAKISTERNSLSLPRNTCEEVIK